MDIIKEIEILRKQTTEILSILGEFKNMFNIADLQSELERAKTLVLKSKNAITELKSTVLAHEATIANQASQIATHLETSNVVTNVTTSFHNVFSELESFLTSEVSTNVISVPLQGIVNNVSSSIVTSLNTLSSNDEVISTNTGIISPSALTIDEVTSEIQSLHDSIIGTASIPAVINTTSIPINTVQEIEALYHALEANMQHNSNPLIDPRLDINNLINATNIKLG